MPLLIVKQKFCASSWLITEMNSQQNVKTPYLNLQPEDVPCQGDRDPLITGFRSKHREE